MKVSFLRHDCGQGSFANLLQTFMGEEVVDKCPFYWKMRGGATYYGNIHYFTLFGIRITINTIKKKDLWIK